MNDFIDKRNSNEGENYVRRHAKAPSAGSIMRQASGPGRNFRGAFATPADLADVDGSGASSIGRRAAAFVPAIVLFLLFIAPAAHAGRVPGFGVLGTGASGTGAGQLGNFPRGVAVNTTGAGGVEPGEVYVVDASNNRVAEYHAGGEFVRAFGQNAVASGPDNVTPTNAAQTIEIPNTVTDGTFSLGFNGATTGGSATGALTEGSAAVTNLVTAKGAGTVVAGSFTIGDLTTSSGQFVVGQPIAGAGIPAGAEITSVAGSTMTISAAATAEGSGVELTSSGPLPFTVGETVSGAGIPVGTTITATGAGTLTLSAPVEAGHSGAGVALTAALPYDATAGAVQSALTTLGSIGTGNATVSGGPGAAAPYLVTFGGALKEAPMPLITVDSSGLSGGTASVVDTTPGVSPYEVCNVAANPTDVCEKGTSSSAAGGIAGGLGIAVDPATGNLFLTSNNSRRIDVYSATGAFEGAFGWRVNASAPAEALQFCTYSTGCAAGASGGDAGQFASLQGAGGAFSAPAIDPLTGHLFVPDPGNRRVGEFSLTVNGSDEVTGAAFVKAFGGDVAPAINEKQQITISGATGGNFALELDSKSTNAAGTGDIEAGSTEIKHINATSGKFARGEEVFAPGIPAGTTISVVTFDSLTLSAAATATTPGAGISAELPYDAEAVGVRSALEALPDVGVNNVAVSGPNGGPWTIEFTGSLEGTNVDQIAGDSSHLQGAGPSITVTTMQTGRNGPAAGTGLNPVPPPVLETCTEATTCQAGAEGDGKEGVFARSAPAGVAIDSTGAIYVVGQPSGRCNGGCGVLKFNSEAKDPQEFAPQQLTPLEGASAESNSVRWVAVDPSNDRIEVIKKVSSNSYKLFEFTRTGAFLDAAPPGVSGSPATATGAGFGPEGFAIGTGGRSYIAMQGNVTSGVPVKILSSPPAPQASIEAASEVSRSAATLSGIAIPSAPGIEGGFPTVAYFEYSTNGVGWTATEPIEVGTGTGSGNPNSCPTNNPPTCNVSQTITGLVAGQPYVARLVVSNGTAATSATTSFETGQAGPSVSSMGTSGVTQDAATLEGKINPNNRSTSYHFEWGPGTGYGTRVPADFDAVVGSGGQPAGVSAHLSGLAPNTTYHFRVVAKSSAGLTFGPDTEFTTLNAAGMPDNRAAELVSPADKKPAGAVRPFIPTQVLFQAAEDGEHAAYPILNGTHESTSGGELIFSSNRSPALWRSAQLSPPSLVPALSDEAAGAGRVRYLDRKDFKCAVIESFNPLTSDTPQIDVENGVINLYRWTASDNSYTLITNRVPLNPDVHQIGLAFSIAGATNDCSRIVFRALGTPFTPGYEYISNASGLYEWDHGVLRDAGLRPDGTAPPGGSAGAEVALNEWSVSPGGRLFFTATSNAGSDSGKQAVFVRKSPTDVVDASQPTTSTPSRGAGYETATPDGSHVFFRANYGLTPVSSSGPVDTCFGPQAESLKDLACDLYDYDVETGELTDISADSNPADSKGAVVQGIMDISEDGSTVYFSARGQLIPGEGPTYNQNLQGSGTASLYRWHEGHLTYIGVLSARDLEENSSGNNQGALIRAARNWVGQTNDNGQYLFFVSRVNMLGNNPEELAQAYFYSAADDSLTCVSCLPEGETPKTYPEEPLTELITTQATQGEGFDNYHPSSLSNDGRAYFNSLEALAPGAVAGQANVYEWYRGQLSLLTTSKVAKYGGILLSKFVGVGGPDGRDAFVVSPERLAPQDTDFATDVYDLRAGGGFPAPPAPIPGCNPALGQCQGGGPGAPAPAAAGTATFEGAGNPQLQPQKKHRKHKKKHRKHRGHHHHKKYKKHKKNKKAVHGKGGKAGRAASVDHGGAK